MIDYQILLHKDTCMSLARVNKKILCASLSECTGRTQSSTWLSLEYGIAQPLATEYDIIIMPEGQELGVRLAEAV